MNHWKNLPQKKFEDDQEILQEAMKDYVEQFVLELLVENTLDDEEINAKEFFGL